MDKKLELEIKKANAFEMAKIAMQNNELEKLKEYISFYKKLSNEYHNLEMEDISKKYEHR